MRNKFRKAVAWGGLGVPAHLTEEQKKAIKGQPLDTHIPPNFPDGLVKYIMFIETNLSNCLERNGYDPAFLMWK
jgi:hypothetical protein